MVSDSGNMDTTGSSKIQHPHFSAMFVGGMWCDPVERFCHRRLGDLEPDVTSEKQIWLWTHILIG